MRAAAGVAVAITLGILVFLTVIICGGIGGQQQANAATADGGPVCATSGPLAGLDATQAANARTIIAVSEARGGDAAAIIATMTSLAEADLRDLGNSGVAGSDIGQGVGSDHDSVGLFQQRASWGTVTQRLDPVISTGLFLDRLLVAPEWQSMAPWMAAQTVQASAFPNGSNYEAQFGRAQQLVVDVDRDATALDCGESGGPPANAAPGSRGLPANYTIPAAATPAEAKAIEFVFEQFGKPYVFGAAGPGAFDCSGLMMAAWATTGVTLVHQSEAQNHEGTPVTSIAQASPGDLITIPGSDGSLAAPGHVGMYLGDGLVVSDTGVARAIQVQTYQAFTAAGLSGIRHIA